MGLGANPAPLCAARSANQATLLHSIRSRFAVVTGETITLETSLVDVSNIGPEQ